MFEKGRLPCVLHQFPRDRLSVVDRGEMMLLIMAVDDLVKPA